MKVLSVLFFSIFLLVLTSQGVAASENMFTQYGKTELVEKTYDTDGMTEREYTLLLNGKVIHKFDKTPMYHVKLEDKITLEDKDLIIISEDFGGNIATKDYHCLSIDKNTTNISESFVGPNDYKSIKVLKKGNSVVFNFKSAKSKEMYGPVIYENGKITVNK